MLTIHVRSRVFSTMDDAAQFVKAIVILYDVYVDAKHQHVLQVGSMGAACSYTIQSASLLIAKLPMHTQAAVTYQMAQHVMPRVDGTFICHAALCMLYET